MDDETPFRKAAQVRPPALAMLASEGAKARRELIAEAREMSDAQRRQRLRIAVQASNDVGCAPTMLLVLGLLLIAPGLPAGAPVVVMLGAALVVGGIWLGRQERIGADRAVTAELAWAESLPFAVTGYRDWLVSERPLLDVTLRAPVDGDLLANAAHAVDASIGVEMLDDRVVRYALPGKPTSSSSGSCVGDSKAFRAFAAELLGPLHNEVGIDKVEMGGAMRRRA